MDFLVGTFNSSFIYTLRFVPPTQGAQSSLNVLARSPAIGSHSWLTLSRSKRILYATAWTDPPSVAAYSIPESRSEPLELINSKQTKARSGYVCCSETHVYSAGGPTGEVYSINEDGGLGGLVQELSFVEDETKQATGENVPHGDFGGLRHGAHSADLSQDGKSLYVADIGRNCVWAYNINASKRDSQKPHLTLGSKHISPRPTDGPRHTTPHPNGKYLYSLQEHSSMVDSFSISPNGTSLRHDKGVKVIPEDKDPKEYWADEVRLSNENGAEPRYLYASTRGLMPMTKGYVAAFKIFTSGEIAEEKPRAIFETPTSGGWANAVEPAPAQANLADVEYLALTDSEEGWVFILSFNGHRFREEARLRLLGDDGSHQGTATAVWL
ncbi:MAG: hypothetical protein Q9160_009173 [Pyrenula sp. 1 TL-2023]